MRNIFILAFALAFMSLHTEAAGVMPAVNTDMGCSSTGQGITYNGSTLACLPPQRPIATVGSGASQLPTCNTTTKGAMYLVTDALTPVALSTVVGGGAITIGVTCNGSNWIVQ